MRIALVTDAWAPQVNGVVRTLSTVVAELERQGNTVLVINPQEFRTLPCPTEPDVRLALATPWAVGHRIRAFAPDAVHIATEGPLGLAARRYCLWTRMPFTTSYHTHFPRYLQMRMGIPARFTYPFIRHFHRHSAAVMVTTDTLRQELSAHGLRNLKLWPRGVDAQLFRPRPEVTVTPAGDRPLMLYVGRVAVEKNLEAFLDLDLPGSKMVVGDGPQLPHFRSRYPDVHFAGRQHGEALARFYAAADVFVFPSRTDTYGLVMLEALASGVPVAAYPVPGPLDVLGDAPQAGCLDDDLAAAVRGALKLSRDDARAFALRHSWQATAERFAEQLAPIPRRAWA